ncbi:hypothetical protein GGR56DRAFT_664259 [Xylariaceae sp. FL0804]|nr:hypothetical protein GGR56DRAFT_664259 [Xylariaceae sp. FL0804]
MESPRPCHHFARGHCRFGTRCRYAHDLEPSRNVANTTPAKATAPVARSRQSQVVSDRVFPLALHLLDSDIDVFKDTIKQLATEDGLKFIRDLADRCDIAVACQAEGGGFRLWECQLKPLLELMSHPRVVDSAVLEQEVATIYNFFVGVGAQRMKTIYDFIQVLLHAWRSTPVEANKPMIAGAALALNVLSKVVDCNTNNVIAEPFTAAAKMLASIVQEPVAESDLFFQLQAEKHLAYLRRRLAVGDAIPVLQTAFHHITDRPEFILHKDLPGRLSSNGPRHDNDHENVQNVQILPTENEIASARAEYLPTTDSSQFHIGGIRGRLDREFRLLREDTVGQLRDTVRGQIEAMRGDGLRPAKTANGNVRTHSYLNPVVSHVSFEKDEGIAFVVSFQQPAGSPEREKRKQWWTRSKRLQSDGLVCMCSDTGATVFFIVAQSSLCTVDEPGARRTQVPSQSGEEPQTGIIATLADDEHLSYVTLVPAENSTEMLTRALEWYRRPQTSHRFCLVEFPGVLLPSFAYTLGALQKMSRHPKLPFADLLAADPGDGGTLNIMPPQYTARPGFSFDLSAITDNNTALSYLPRDTSSAVVTSERLSQCSSLDSTQAESLINTLSRELSLIQGPPGTGKSFLGEKLVKVLLSNKRKADLGPILCVSYTNHALDQLLEHLLEDGIKQIIRIGSRSKVEKLENLNLRMVSQKVERTRSEKHSLWDFGRGVKESTLLMNEALVALRDCTSFGSLKIYLKYQYPEHYSTLLGTDEGDGWTRVGKDPRQRFRDWLTQGEASLTAPRPTEWLLRENLFQLSHAEREKLHNRWLDEIYDKAISNLRSENASYLDYRKLRDKVRHEIDLRCLQGADVIGVTTTGLARNLDLLSKLRCKVLLCEEAGEVQEAHLLTALLPSVEHAILIGDHRQLKPQIQNYELQSTNPRGAQYSLDVSLFERLVQPPYDTDGRVPFSTLDTQRRMHPSISKLIRSTIYPTLEDGKGVKEYPEVIGMEKRLFWLQHEKLEASAAASDPLGTSHTNDFEVDMVTMLVRHLVRQGSYGSGDIAVITPYLGQLHRLRDRMSSLFEITVNERDQVDLDILNQDRQEAEEHVPSKPTNQVSKATLLKSVRVATIDNFQGEEAKIIIISMVRSNPQGRCGFVSTPNRINVLLSRAQHGMYIIGNPATFAHVPMWTQVLTILEEEGNLGRELRLQCPRHPDLAIRVSEPDHFLQLAPEGGCDRACHKRLDCGHTCISRCHSDVIHRAVKCREPCPRPKKGCDHPCRLACGDQCLPKCLERLENLDLVLYCGHRMSSALCWQTQNPSAVRCEQLVAKTVPGCGHSVRVPCHVLVDAPGYRCDARCDSARPCGHNCRSPCHMCRERDENGAVTRENHGICGQVCGRDYTSCRHGCRAKCHGESQCPPCTVPCEVRCSHSRCSKPCHEPCAPCAEQDCASHCPHTRCTMPCAGPCDWVPCSKRCENRLSCGHQCPSVCGEACPDAKFCQQCCSEEIRSTDVDFIMGLEYHEIDLDEDPCIFPDCGHFRTRTNMDGLMDMTAHYNMSGEELPNAILKSSRPFSMDEIKVCPTCRGSLRSIARYGRIVRRAMLDETSKKFITWSNSKHADLARRLLDVQEGIESRLKNELAADPTPGRKGKLSLSTSRATQLRNVCSFATERYAPALLLRQEISNFRNSVSREEQPYQRVADLVQHAKRLRKTDASFTFDESVIQLKGQQQASLLLLRCESIVFLDFVRMYQAAESRPEVKVNLTQHLQDCEVLIGAAQRCHRPRQEIEGHIYYANFCAVARALAAAGGSAAGAESESLRDAGRAHLAAARKVMSGSGSSAAALAPELDAAERVLNEGVFYGAVSADEMRAVYAAMAAEFSGTGHWYVCENEHPFTVGECGMPMEEARCPECGRPVGGRSHVPAEGVRHAAALEDELVRGVGRLHM